MWRLLPVYLLVSCAATDHRQPVGGEQPRDHGRIVRQVELPMDSPARTAEGQPRKRNFNRRGAEGWLDETGAWHIRQEVRHGRLRRGVYETGIQLGTGDSSCSKVEWLTGVQYTTRLRHCNSAIRIHAAGGTFPDLANRFEDVNCARVVVRCDGVC